VNNLDRFREEKCAKGAGQLWSGRDRDRGRDRDGGRDTDRGRDRDGGSRDPDGGRDRDRYRRDRDRRDRDDRRRDHPRDNGYTAKTAGIAVMSSQASEVTAGRRIHVSSVASEVRYAYDVASVPCILGLSVAPGLVFAPSPSPSSLLEDAKTLIQRLVEATAPPPDKIFTADECVVCLGEHPDVVLYTCGHQCVHASCLSEEVTRCPMCRQSIAARVRAPAQTAEPMTSEEEVAVQNTNTTRLVTVV